MIALLDNIAMLHKQNVIRIHNGGQAMCNNKVGSAVHQGIHSLDNLDFGSSIYGRGDLVLK